MAIKVIRICDKCGLEYPQSTLPFFNYETKEKVYTCPIDFVCSDCILKESRRQDSINELDDLQSKENEGRGISCICSIILCLRREDSDTAKRVYQIEGDKIRQYPKVEKWLLDNFGCRTHLKKNCDNWLCERLSQISSIKSQH